MSGGVDGLAAAPRSPSHTVLVGRHYERSQSRGGAVAVGTGEAGNGCPGMASEVVRQSVGGGYVTFGRGKIRTWEASVTLT